MPNFNQEEVVLQLRIDHFQRVMQNLIKLEDKVNKTTEKKYVVKVEVDQKKYDQSIQKIRTQTIQTVEELQRFWKKLTGVELPKPAGTFKELKSINGLNKALLTNINKQRKSELSKIAVQQEQILLNNKITDGAKKQFDILTRQRDVYQDITGYIKQQIVARNQSASSISPVQKTGFSAETLKMIDAQREKQLKTFNEVNKAALNSKNVQIRLGAELERKKFEDLNAYVNYLKQVYTDERRLAEQQAELLSKQQAKRIELAKKEAEIRKAALLEKQRPYKALSEKTGYSEPVLASIDRRRKKELKVFDQIVSAKKKNISIREKLELDLERLKLSSLKRYLPEFVKNNKKIVAEGKRLHKELASQGIYITQAQAIGRVEKSLSQYSSSAKGATKANKDFSRELIKNVQQHENLNKALDVAIGKLIRYRIVFGVMYKMYQSFIDSIKLFIDVNYQLAQIGKVIQPTQKELEAIKDTAFDLASAYGQSIGQILESFKMWGQMGLRQRDLQNAVNATLVASNALGIEATAITESLTAAIFSYGVETGNLTSVIDKWMAVQRMYPVTAQDLANGMKQVGVAAKNLGIDMDELNGMIASIAAVTRKTGREVGTSLKTMFARIPREATIKALQDVGVYMMKDETTFRSVSKVLDDLAIEWQKMNDVQKTSIAQQVAGVRRYTDFIALMENHNVALSAAATSQAAYGEALQANQREMLTFKKTFASLKAQFAKAGEIFGNSLAPLMKDFIKVGEVLAKVFGNKVFARFIKSMVVLGGVFITGKALVMAYSFVVNKMYTGLLLTVPSVDKLKTSLLDLGKSEQFATAQAIRWNKALMVMRKSTVILLTLSAIISAFYVIRDIIGSTSEEIEAFNDNIIITADQIKNTQQRIQGIQKQIDAFKGLNKEREDAISQLKKLNPESEKYIALMKSLNIKNSELARHSKEINILMGLYGDTLNTTTDGITSMKTAVDELIESKKKLLLETQKELELKASQFLKGKTKEEYAADLAQQRPIIAEYIRLYTDAAGKISQIMENESLAKIITKGIQSGAITARSSMYTTIKYIKTQLQQDIDKVGLDDIMGQIMGDARLSTEQQTALSNGVQEMMDYTQKRIDEVLPGLWDYISAAPKGMINAWKNGLKTSGFEETGKIIADDIEKGVDRLDKGFESANKLAYDHLNSISDKMAMQASTLEALNNDLTKPIKDPKYDKDFDKISASLVNMKSQWESLKNSLNDPKMIATAIARQKEYYALQQKEFVTVKALSKAYNDNYKGVLNQITNVEKKMRDINGEMKVQQQIIDQYGEKSDQGKAAIKQKDKLQQAYDEFNKFLIKLQEESRNKLIDLSKAILSTTKQLKQLEITIRNITQGIQRQTALIATRASIIKQLTNDDVKGLEAQLTALSNYRAYIESIYEQKKRGKIVDEGLVETYRKQVLQLKNAEYSLETQIKQAKILKSIKPYIDMTTGFRGAVASGLSNLQSSWLRSAEERQKISEQIYYKQLDLNEAIASGEKEAILKARSELRELQDDLKKVNEWWVTIGESIRDAFLQLSNKMFQDSMNAIADRFTQLVFDMKKGQEANITHPFASNTNQIIDNTYLGVQNQVDNIANNINKNMKKGGEVAGDMVKKRMLVAGGLIAGQLAAAILGKQGPGAARGSQIGGLVGQGVIAKMGGVAAINPMLAFALPLIGGIAGAFIGSMADKNDYKDNTHEVKKNTDAIQANTNALEELNKIIINAPPRYRLPVIGGGLTSGTVNIGNLHVGGGEQGASDFIDVLAEYGIDLRTTRSRARVVI